VRNTRLTVNSSRVSEESGCPDGGPLATWRTIEMTSHFGQLGSPDRK